MAGTLGGCAEDHAKFVASKTQEWHKTQERFIFEVAEQEYKVGDFEKCRDTLRPVLAGDPSYPPVLILAAKVEMDQGGSLETARDELTHAINLKADDAEPYYLLGVVYQRWQQMQTACDNYQLAVDRAPTNVLYVLAVAEMQIALGNLDRAHEML